MKLRFTLLLVITFISTPFALEIDEKLTTRFLKVSKSMRTVLVNRGLEDGLVVGDHAKFFLTTGVIARGYVVKASPTRTIWSIYRLVNTDKLYKDMAVNIKITSPVQVTNDPTKSLYATATQSQVEVFRGDAMTMDGEQKDLNQDPIDEMKEINELTAQAPISQIDKSKSWETFALIHYNSLSSSVTEQDGQTFNGSDASVDYSIGVEKYFGNFKSMLKQISLFAILHGGSDERTSVEGQKVTSSVFEFGGGVNIHFLSSPFATYRLIPYASASFGMGSTSTKTDFLGSNNSGITSDETNGDASFLSFGLGAKYFTKSGLGFRTLVDYYTRSETYTFENSGQSDTESKRTISGPRILFGLAYRW